MTGSTSALPDRARWVWMVAAALFVAHLALAGRYGIFRDELYYVACGRHLDFGYVDHPPLVALIARAATSIFGHSLRGLRFFPALGAAATVWLGAELARTMRGSAFAQLLAAIALAFVPVLRGTSSFLSMNFVEPLAWTAAALFATRALVEKDDGAWIHFGAACGIGLLAKHSMLFWGASLTVGILATSHRGVLRTRGPWIAAGIAALMLAPNVIWEIRHGWPTLEFMHNAQTRKMLHLPIGTFVKDQILQQGPTLLPIWASGLLWLLVAKRARPFRFLAVAFIALFAVILVQSGKPYYVAPAYPVLFAAGGVAFESWFARPALRPSIVAFVALTSLPLLPLVLPILPPATLRTYIAKLGIAPTQDEKHAEPPLPQLFADQFGWEPMVSKLAAAFRTLTPEEQRVAVIWTTNYGEAGAVDWFGPALGLPPASCGHNNYFLWGPPPADRGAVVISVSEEREDLEKTYDDCRQVDETDAPWAMPYEDHQPIFICRKPKRSVQSIWPETKTYI
jgi:4-amino-4-deoxy-L-arabinose transferase-like glycosyltransferase